MLLRFVPLFLVSLSIVATATPQTALRTADRLAWRGNWVKAGPFYAQAEEEFNQAGDSKNALKAKVGRLRSQMQSTLCTELSREIDQALGNSMVITDPELKLQALAYKGEIAHQSDLWVAKEAWEEVLRLSKTTGNKAWEARATGELGVVTYVVDGDGARATLLIGKALFKVAETQDSWAEAIYLTHTGNALSTIGRHEVALKYFEKALTATGFSLSPWCLYW